MLLKIMTLGLVAGLLLVAPTASAFDWDAWRAEREAARVERAAEREARRAERNEPEEDIQEESICRHSVSLSLAKPSLRIRGAEIILTPLVDVTVRTSGDTDAPAWEAAVNFEGTTVFTAGTVPLPSGQGYSGEAGVASGLCGTDYSRKGFPLGDFVVGTLSQGLSIADELAGNLTLKADVTGLKDTNEEHRQIKFEFEAFSTPDLGYWRTVR